MKRVLGGFIFLLGLLMGAWVLYNLFINTLPEARGRNPFGAIALSAGCIYVGV